MQKPIRPVKPYFVQGDIDTAKTYVQEILESGMLTLGKYTQQFEQAFALRRGAAIIVSNSKGPRDVLRDGIDAPDGSRPLPYDCECAVIAPPIDTR